MNRAQLQSKLDAAGLWPPPTPRDQIEVEWERRELVAHYEDRGEEVPEHLKFGDVFYLYTLHKRRGD